MKDTITATFVLEADFTTIQHIRLALADTQRQDLLSRTLTKALHKHIQAETGSDFSLETKIKVSSYRDTKRGPQDPIPQVKKGVLYWFDAYEGTENRVAKVGSKYWLQWLDDPENRSFSYISKDQATFTAMKRKDGVWYAHKRLKGTLKRKYLGKGERLTQAKMDQVAFELAQLTLV